MVLGAVLAVGKPFIVTAFFDSVLSRNAKPSMDQAEPSRVARVFKHGPIGFSERWRIVGPIARFDPHDWPQIRFYQQCSDEVVVYDGRRVRPIWREPGHGNRERLPEEGVSGHLFVERVLARELGVIWGED
jgi:hypothetical protein